MTVPAARQSSDVPVIGRSAGLVSAEEDVHAVESGFAGLSALCGAGTITRQLRAPFAASARGVCPDCARLVASPAALADARSDLML